MFFASYAESCLCRKVAEWQRRRQLRCFALRDGLDLLRQDFQGHVSTTM